MTLVLATILAGLLLLACGIFLLKYSSPMRAALTAFPRSQTATLVLLIVATGIVLLKVSQLGEADFGKYKNLLFGFFLLLSVGAWFWVPDFLGIRALSVLGLILSGQFLSAAYFQPYETRLFLVVFSYIMIAASLYLAAVPYRFRDAITRINGSNRLRKTAAGTIIAYGIILCLSPLTYTA